MCWRGQFYVWKVLPFGVKLAPFVFNKILRLVISHLRCAGLRTSLFVEDFFQMASPQLAIQHREILLNTLQRLGWDINLEKSQLKPSTTGVFIGFNIYSTGKKGPWLAVLPAKIKKLKKVLKSALKLKYIKARQLARIAGQCIAMMKAVLPAKLLLRNVYRTLARKETWEESLLLDQQCVTDLKWWLDAVDNWNGAPLNVRSPDLQIETDASGSGYGAVCHSLKLEVAGFWTSNISDQSSNFRELLVVRLSLQALKRHLSGKSVQILSDNITAVAHLNQLRGQCELLNRLARTIFAECQDSSIDLSAKFLRGKDNSHADGLSRIYQHQSPYEWSLHPEMFFILDRMCGHHTVDRFASASNALKKRFNSLYHDVFSEGVDAMAQFWGQDNNYINPPFFLLAKIVEKILRDRAVATVIAPFWPAQTWCQKLQSMLRLQPVQIPKAAIIGLNPEALKNHKWKIYAWPVYGGADSERNNGMKNLSHT